MRIIIITKEPYPNGYALTKRLHLYAKGLIKYNDVKIIISKATEKDLNTLNNKTNGFYDNVQFQYASNSTNRNKIFLKRRLHDFISFSNTLILLIKLNPDIIIVTSFSTFFYLILKIVSKILNFKIVKEKNEIDRGNQESFTRFQFFKIKLYNSIFDAFITITDELKFFINRDLKLKTPCITVPILINDFYYETQQQPYIVYNGTYIQNKDGILDIIKAFNEISAEFPNYKLILTGSPNNSPDYKSILRLAHQNIVNGRIIFTGYLDDCELKKKILEASILINAKPNNRINKYNFPTKFGEYLITGNPILTTPVGIIYSIFHKRSNIVFTNKEHSNIAEQIKMILSDFENIKYFSKANREFALENLNYEHHTKRLNQFLKVIKK